MASTLDDPPVALPGTAQARAAPVIDWVVRAVQGAPEVTAFLAAIGERIRAAGMPLARFSLHTRTLHPDIRGFTGIWWHGKGAQIVPRYHGAENEPTYQSSPIPWIIGGVDRFRRHLEHPDVALDFGILAELKAEGITDYLVVRMPFTDRTNSAMTWATDRPGGFSDDDIAFLDALLPYLALVFEVRVTHRTAEALLRVYLGADAGTRVLRGQVTRGSGQTISAAILFADIRGFTELSETLPGDAMIGLLNEYFESVIGPVEDHGGEVLKLIGDGILAIFPLNRGGARPACLAAYAAARSAFARLVEVNRRRAAAGASIIRTGITFHLGSVIYGNIGGANRLDFTVIGPAVNLVSRLQSLCSQLDKGMLLSAAFAKEAGLPVVSVGHHRLRGVTAVQEVFALPPSEDPYHGTPTAEP